MHSNCTTSKFYGDIWCDLATCCFYWVFSTSFLALVFQSHCFKGSVPNSWLSGSVDVQAHGAAALCHTSVCTLSFCCLSAGTLGCVDVQRCRANASPFCLLGGFSHKKGKCLTGTAAWVKNKVETEQLRRPGSFRKSPIYSVQGNILSVSYTDLLLLMLLAPRQC